MTEKDSRSAGMPGSVLTSRYEGINRTENQSSEKFKTRSLRPEGCGTRSHLCACILEMSGLKFCAPPASSHYGILPARTIWRHPDESKRHISTNYFCHPTLLKL